MYSGKDGSLLWNFLGDAPKALFGWYVSGAGDVDGDGAPDVIGVGIGADSTVPARTRVFSGATGTILHAFGGAIGPAASNGAALGDLDGDGHDDLLIRFDELSPIIATIRAISGKTGESLLAVKGNKFNGKWGDALDGSATPTATGGWTSWSAPATKTPRRSIRRSVGRSRPTARGVRMRPA